jgi:hypothetical protein
MDKMGCVVDSGAIQFWPMWFAILVVVETEVRERLVWILYYGFLILETLRFKYIILIEFCFENRTNVSLNVPKLTIWVGVRRHSGPAQAIKVEKFVYIFLTSAQEWGEWTSYSDRFIPGQNSVPRGNEAQWAPDGRPFPDLDSNSSP